MFQSNSVREQQQQMEMVQSICIPRVFPNITEAKIRKVFSTLDIGEIDKIDMVSKTNSKGQEYKIVFIHMLKWNNTETIRKMKEKLIEGKDVKIVYDDPWFWKVVINHKKQQTSNSSHTTQYPEHQHQQHLLNLQLPEHCPPRSRQQRLQHCNDADYRRYDDLQSSHIHQHQPNNNYHHNDEYSGNGNGNGNNGYNYSQEQYYQTHYNDYSSRSRGDERGRRGVGGCGNDCGRQQYDNQRHRSNPQVNNQHYNQQRQPEYHYEDNINRYDKYGMKVQVSSSKPNVKNMSESNNRHKKNDDENRPKTSRGLKNNNTSTKPKTLSSSVVVVVKNLKEKEAKVEEAKEVKAKEAIVEIKKEDEEESFTDTVTVEDNGYVKQPSSYLDVDDPDVNSSGFFIDYSNALPIPPKRKQKKLVVVVEKKSEL
jgi:hypothetical protein